MNGTNCSQAIRTPTGADQNTSLFHRRAKSTHILVCVGYKRSFEFLKCRLNRTADRVGNAYTVKTTIYCHVSTSSHNIDIIVHGYPSYVSPGFPQQHPFNTPSSGRVILVAPALSTTISVGIVHPLRRLIKKEIKKETRKTRKPFGRRMGTPLCSTPSHAFNYTSFC